MLSSFNSPIISRPDWIIQRQHRDLFALIGGIQDAIATHTQFPNPELNELLDQFEQFILARFAQEEQVMLTCGYPDFEGHKLRHAQIKRLVHEVIVHIHCDRSRLSSKLTLFVSEWIKHHLQHEDRSMLTWLRERAPMPPVLRPSLGGNS